MFNSLLRCLFMHQISTFALRSSQIVRSIRFDKITSLTVPRSTPLASIVRSTASINKQSEKKIISRMISTIPVVNESDPKGVVITECRSITDSHIKIVTEPFKGLHAFPEVEQYIFVVRGASSFFQIPPEILKFEDLIGASLSEFVGLHAFRPKIGSKISVEVPKSFRPLRVVSLIGGGYDEDKMNSYSFVRIAQQISESVVSAKSQKIAIVFTFPVDPFQLNTVVRSIILSGFPDYRFKSEPPKESACNILSDIFVQIPNQLDPTGLVEKSKAVSTGINFASQLTNAPANYVNPCSLANSAVKMCQSVPSLSIKILEKPEIEKLGMGAYLAVGKGSMYPPMFIHITYRSLDEPIRRKVAFIGKGICFDSGGYNLKASAGSEIELMKFDMGGAAAVIGAALAIGTLKPSGIECHFIVPATENMISSKAYRPGDIITASNRKTIEVGNTDAEGRLTLADALVYADKLNVDSIVDFATLTGACRVALGVKYAGMWSSDNVVAKHLLESAENSGELLWRMPLASEYREMIDSKFADLQNAPGPLGGAITAAVFLKEFVQKTPWAHVDIAGPALDSGRATGYGVATMVEYVLN